MLTSFVLCDEFTKTTVSVVPSAVRQSISYYIHLRSFALPYVDYHQIILKLKLYIVLYLWPVTKFVLYCLLSVWYLGGYLGTAVG